MADLKLELDLNLLSKMDGKELHAFKVPFFDTMEQLQDFIKMLVEREHTYDTSMFAMSLAAVAAFNFVAGTLGCTGYQSSHADLDIVRRTRGIDHPFMLIQLSDYLYPQYNLHEKLEEFIGKNSDWIRETLSTYITEKSKEEVAPRVWNHWLELIKTHTI